MCSGVAAAESPATAPVLPSPDRAAIRAERAQADADDHATVRAARIKADAAEKADVLPKSWDRDGNGKRPWER